MCVSAVVETDRQKLAERLGLISLEPFVSPAATEASYSEDLPRRIESRGEAWVVRATGSGRLTAERMTFNPYIVRNRDIGGDMWTSSLLASNHGLLIVKSFSEWVSLDLLLTQGLIGLHDATCAYNRCAPHSPRLVLANFTPSAPLLVPVLFDAKRAGDAAFGPHPQVPGSMRDFVVISGDAPRGASLAIDRAPISLNLETAMEWLHTEDPEASSDADPASVLDFQEILADNQLSRAGDLAFSLFKTA